MLPIFTAVGDALYTAARVHAASSSAIGVGDMLPILLRLVLPFTLLLGWMLPFFMRLVSTLPCRYTVAMVSTALFTAAIMDAAIYTAVWLDTASCFSGCWWMLPLFTACLLYTSPSPRD